MAFYNDGLRFTCQRCGDCCKGADAYVWLYSDDLSNMAAYLGITEREFRAEYTSVFDKALVLKSFPNGDCIFFDEKKGCRVHPARPTQCRTFPFWAEYLRNENSWALVAKRCPGVNIGELHSKEEIMHNLKEMGGF